MHILLFLLVGLSVLTLRAEDPPVVYVSDFEVDVKPSDPKDSDDDGDRDDINNLNEDNVFPERGPIRGLLGRLRGDGDDPQAQARMMVETMSNKLVAELKDEDFDAMRIIPTAARPTSGWLLKGVFTQVDDGKRLRRAMIGFGAGQTEVSVYATLQDLSQPDQPLYRIDADADKGKMPGAVLMMNPYVAAAKFVMSKKDLEKTVKKAANEIAEQVIAKLRPDSKS